MGNSARNKPFRTIPRVCRWNTQLFNRNSTRNDFARRLNNFIFLLWRGRNLYGEYWVESYTSWDLLNRPARSRNSFRIGMGDFRPVRCVSEFVVYLHSAEFTNLAPMRGGSVSRRKHHSRYDSSPASVFCDVAYLCAQAQPRPKRYMKYPSSGVVSPRVRIFIPSLRWGSSFSAKAWVMT